MIMNSCKRKYRNQNSVTSCHFLISWYYRSSMWSQHCRSKTCHCLPVMHRLHAVPLLSKQFGWQFQLHQSLCRNSTFFWSQSTPQQQPPVINTAVEPSGKSTDHNRAQKEKRTGGLQATVSSKYPNHTVWKSCDFHADWQSRHPILLSEEVSS